MTDRPNPAELLGRMLRADEWEMNAMVEEGLIRRDRYGDVSFSYRNAQGDHCATGMSSMQLTGWYDRTAEPVKPKHDR